MFMLFKLVFSFTQFYLSPSYQLNLTVDTSIYQIWWHNINLFLDEQNIVYVSSEKERETRKFCLLAIVPVGIIVHCKNNEITLSTAILEIAIFPSADSSFNETYKYILARLQCGGVIFHILRRCISRQFLCFTKKAKLKVAFSMKI